MAKGSQNGGKIDAKTHPKSMPKMMSKKERNLMEKHEKRESEKSGFRRRSPYCCSNSRVPRFDNGAKSASKKWRKSMRKPSQNQSKNHAKSMLNPCSEKWCQNDRKIIQNGSQKQVSVDPARNVKIELPCKRELDFPWPEDSQKRRYFGAFLNLFQEPSFVRSWRV